MGRSKRKAKKSIFSGFSSIALAVLAALSVRWLLIEAYVIPSGSMLPTLLIHDHIFVNKIKYGIRAPFGKTWILDFEKPKKNDVVVFRYPKDEKIFFIKRVIGTPGDEIHYDDGILYINQVEVERIQPPTGKDGYKWMTDSDVPGGKQDYDYFYELMDQESHPTLLRRSEYHMSWGPEQIPNGYIFVMGDNRDNSNDSRHWGFVPMENILGKAMFVWLSCNDTLPIVSFLCNPIKLRWGRFFDWIR